MEITICFEQWTQSKFESIYTKDYKVALDWMMPELPQTIGFEEYHRLLQEFLSLQERKRYLAFNRNSQRQHEMLLTRVLLKRLIRGYLANNYGLNLKDHKEIIIGNVKDGKQQGKPYLKIKDKNFAELSVSLAHCSKMLGAVIGEGCFVGIDVEEVKPVGQGFLNIFLGNEEKQLLTSSFAELDFNQKTILMWCAKEAIGKALGTGFSLGFSSMRFRSVGENGLLKLQLDEGLNKYVPYLNPQIHIYYSLYTGLCRVLCVIYARHK